MRESPITMMRAAGDVMAYTQSGAVVDRRGYVVDDEMGIGTMLARGFGFYPSSASGRYDLIRMSNKITDYQRDVVTSWRTAWVKAMMRGDVAAAREIEKDVADWNAGSVGTGLEIRNFVANSVKALKQARMPVAVRTLKSAPEASRKPLSDMMDMLSEN